MSDVRSRLGPVDAVAYRDATREKLARYFVIFVIDDDARLDVPVLRDLAGAGTTVHLIGDAAKFAPEVSK
jgi:hypothetical protein